MLRKLTAKKLTASDLTLFEWHFKNRNAGNQKAINLNADVFINTLYPILPELAVDRGGKIPLDLQIYGPGNAQLLNLQRKVIKIGSYKNWRLNGEFIYNPTDAPERFNVLIPGDIVIFEFNGIDIPSSAKAIFISNNLPIDKPLWAGFNALLGSRAMNAVSLSEVESIIHAAEPSSDHPIHELTVSKELEEIILTGQVDLKKLREKPSLRRISKEDLIRAKRNAEDKGRRGEELISSFLLGEHSTNKIKSFFWESDLNPIYPYDFYYINLSDEKIFVEVKSTEGEFERDFYISNNELKQAIDSPHYHIFRVYNIQETKACLRICTDIKEIAKQVLDIFRSLPEGVKANGISISPKKLSFSDELLIQLKDEIDE